MELPINYEDLRDIANNYINPQFKHEIDSILATGENKENLINITGRKDLAVMSEEAWIDFIIGVLLMSITLGYIKVY